MLIESLPVGQPGLQGGAGNFEGFGGLTLRNALGVELVVVLETLGAFESMPVLLTRPIDTLDVRDYGSHGYLLLHPATLIEKKWLRMTR
jgi:hypothetical protein